jgi:hypothetical protein
MNAHTGIPARHRPPPPPRPALTGVPNRPSARSCPVTVLPGLRSATTPLTAAQYPRLPAPSRSAHGAATPPAPAMPQKGGAR